MNKSHDFISTVYHFSEFIQRLNQLNNREYSDVIIFISEKIDKDELKRLDGLINSSDKNNLSTRRKDNLAEPFEQFKFDIIMNKLKNAVLHNSSESDNAGEIDWLLNIMLVSPKLFASIRELTNFLTNITGLEYDAKNPGRDRIVDYYMREIRKMPVSEQNRTLLKMAKYLFVNMPSNYKEWKEILYKEGKRS